MLTLFLEFLSYITHNLTEYVAVLNDDATYRKVISVYTLLNRIALNFEKFSEILVFGNSMCVKVEPGVALKGASMQLTMPYIFSERT